MPTRKIASGFAIGTHEVYQGSQCKRHLPLFRIVGKETGKCRAPVAEQRHKFPFVDEILQTMLGPHHDPHSLQRGRDSQAAVGDGKRSLYFNRQLLRSLFKLLLIVSLRTVLTPVDAAMQVKIARMFGMPVQGNVGGRCKHNLPEGRAYRESDHIVLKIFL